MREFDSGATRDTDEGKYDYEGFLSPLVLERFAEYMHTHRVQADGGLRDSDNWQKGIPQDAYMKSGWRHFFDWWKLHRNIPTNVTIEDALCALMFNVMGYLHERLAARVVKCGYLSRKIEYPDGSGYHMAPCRYPERHSGPHEG